MTDEVQPLAATTLVYDYESQSGQPPSGKAYQAAGTPSEISFNYTDNGSTNQTTFFNALVPGGTISGAGVTWLIEAITLRGSNALITVQPDLQGSPFGVTSFVFTPAATGTSPTFPAFTTPAPPTASGQPPPPVFPPVSPGTAPVTVPVGPLAVPEPIVPAAVPPSTAGFPLIRYGAGGSATVPPVNGYFTKFTTTTAYAGFPNNPPAGVPIVFSNTFNGAVADAGKDPPWKWNPPPSTPTVAQITLNGYAPVWTGLMTPPEVSMMTLPVEPEGPDAGTVHSGNSGPAKRRRRPVLPAADSRQEY